MYRQLTREQRYAIYLGLQEKKTYTAIARQIGCSVSTVSREVSRNTNRHGHYLWKDAVELTSIRRERSVSNRKVKPHILKEKRWSPEQISGWLRKKGIFLSKERIYQEIRANRETLARYTHHGMKYRRHQAKPYKTAGKSMIPNRVSIHERPKEADGKRFGDWEMDLVIGSEQKSAVLTIIERSQNMLLQTKLPSKKPEEVAKAVIRLLLPYKKDVLTITTDNGIEFRDHKQIAKAPNCIVYFADPCCSGQKGAIENANKLLREFFPKGTDFRDVSQEQLNAAQYMINDRPRKKLGFSTPKIEFFRRIS